MGKCLESKTDVHRARELHTPWTADHKGKSVGPDKLEVVARRHALSSRWMRTFNHNTCKNHLEEAQGAATSSLFMPPRFQDVAVCTALVCGAQCSMPVRFGH